MREYSFIKGWSQVQNKDVKSIKRELMEALGIANNKSSRQSFYQRKTGRIVPRAPEAKIIEGIFAKYGITEVWGEFNESIK